LLLALVAAGLACFGVWRGLQAFVDADHRGRGMKAGVQRAVYAGAAMVNFGLAFWAASIAISSSPTARGEDKTVHDWTAWVMHFPFGRWLVVFTGVGVVIGAIGMGLRALSEKPAVRLLPQAPSWIILVGRIGFLTRGLVFLLIGVFLAGAGLNVSSSEAKGLAGALRSLEQQSYGSLLVGLTGAGLIAFAVFEAVQARWRKIEVPRTRGFLS
jgi:hypothetical protein